MVLSAAVMENEFAEDFKKILQSSNAKLRSLREKAFGQFSENGFPTVRAEDWKYTNIAPIAKEKWRVGDRPASVPELDGEFEELLAAFRSDRNGFAALNLAFSDLVCIRIPKETSVDKPYEISFAGEPGAARFPHFLVIAEAGSRATLIERYTSDSKSFTNTAIQILVKDNASLTHYRVQKESSEAFHVGTTEVEIGRGGRYDSTSINLGGVLARHDIDVRFTADGGEAHVDGLYMLDDSQHSDTHSVIDHLVPNCTSRQTYKGVLNGTSRAVFNGKVFVRENAHGTDSQQTNKNLLLSNDARVDTKPQLEIFNDDVKCAHGATVGQLEEEELFYLLTRGLPENLARNLLTYGFAEEIISKIGIEAIKTDLDEFVLNRLNVKLEV